MTSNPTTTNVQALISQLQEDKHFGQIGKELSDKLKFKGLSIVEKIRNVILRLKKKKDNISSNMNTLAMERTKSDDCVSLLKMII